MKGYRLLTQVMPYRYRQGFTYPTKGGGAHQKRMKIYGGKILRKYLKDKLREEIENIE